MDGIIESVKRLIDVTLDKLYVDTFAEQEYHKKFPRDVKRTGFHYYDSYEILSETQLKIIYKYGYGDYEYTNSFIVDLLPISRDNKIDTIVKII